MLIIIEYFVILKQLRHQATVESSYLRVIAYCLCLLCFAYLFLTSETVKSLRMKCIGQKDRKMIFMKIYICRKIIYYIWSKNIQSSSIRHQLSLVKKSNRVNMFVRFFPIISSIVFGCYALHCYSIILTVLYLYLCTCF